MAKFTDPTPSYVESVKSGKMLVSKAVMHAVKRFEKDRQRTDWPWVFNPELAGKAVKFMEILPEPKTGKPQPLAGFQKFIIANIYGWVDKDDSTIRRFKEIFISIARKNGKSLLISGIVLYEFLFGKNPANKRQMFTAANDRDQARIVFEMVQDRLKALCRKDDEIRKMVKINRSEVVNLNDGSIIRAFSREVGSVDGYEPHVAVVDEYANAKTTDMVDTLNTGQLLLASPLTVIISTAGFNMNAPMFTQNYPYAKKVLSGEETADEYFAFIAEQDNVEEVDDPKNWVKSNPLLSVSSLQKQITSYLKNKLSKARAEGNLNNILVKNFNIWRQAEENSYMDYEVWKNAKVDVKPDIHGQRAWIGVDVGRTSDLFAITWLIPIEGNWYLDGYGFVATKYGLDSKIKTDKINYRAVAERGEGEITQLESGIIDNERVYEWLVDFVAANELDVQGICFDPWQFGTLLTMIEKNHPEWPMVQVRQGTMTLSMPTKQFHDDVVSGKLTHSGNELLTTAVNNAVLMSDNNGVRIDKNKYANKIDMLDAALDAYAIAFTENIDDFITDDDILNGDFGF